jgi:hypothetical protein
VKNRIVKCVDNNVKSLHLDKKIFILAAIIFIGMEFAALNKANVKSTGNNLFVTFKLR